MSDLMQQIADRHTDWQERLTGAEAVSPEVDRAFLLSLCSAQAIELAGALRDLRHAAEASLRIAHDTLGEEVRAGGEAQASLRPAEADGAERQDRRWASYVQAVVHELVRPYISTGELLDNIAKAESIAERALAEAQVQEYRP